MEPQFTLFLIHYIKVKNFLTFSAGNGLFVLQQLMTAVLKTKTMSLQDLGALTSIITEILNKTDISTGSFQDVKHYAKVKLLSIFLDRHIKDMVT